MSIINSIKSIKKIEIEFTERTMDSDDVFSVKFSKPRDFSYRTGQYGLFMVKNKKTTHMFSVASSPSEDFLLLGTIVNHPISL